MDTVADGLISLSGKLMKIFLSHSSKDKPSVRRIHKALQSHKFDTWLDEERIPFGGSIVEFVEKGLSEADVLIVFLSEHSVMSKWVESEWQAQFFEQINRKNVSVIPLLLGDCEIPRFLKGRLYADFRNAEDFETNLSILIGQLQRIKSDLRQAARGPRQQSKGSVLEYTNELIKELSREYISMPHIRRMPLIDTLKKMPRQGKRRRLANFEPRVRIRSVYDHVLSVAHVADCMLPSIRHGVPDQEMASLALCIAFHELNEVVLGDIPSYTSLDSRRNVKTAAEDRLRGVPPGRREKIATEFVWLFLSEKNRQSADAVTHIFDDQTSDLYKLFKLLDKMDPIIAVWRYLHEYRGKLGANPKEFNSVMKDFYENPDIRSFAKANKFDSSVYELILNLQDRSKSWDYYMDPEKLFGDAGLFGVESDVVRRMIEGTPLFHTAKRGKQLQ
jgi:5'-deoxynucleotidase YfbR-like HD superfamily hydrolase